MVHVGWFISSPWWWLALYLPALAFTLPVGSGPKESRP
jgi:hypothetical protein